MTQLKTYDTGSSTWIPIQSGAQGTLGTQGTTGAQGIQGLQGGVIGSVDGGGPTDTFVSISPSSLNGGTP